jgi:hypothetical protein
MNTKTTVYIKSKVHARLYMVNAKRMTGINKNKENYYRIQIYLFYRTIIENNSFGFLHN